MAAKLFVTIAMPALNEEAFIRDAVLSILPDPDTIDCEVLVLDGESEDATKDIVRAVAEQDPRVRIVENPRRIQASAVNLAARLADKRATFLVRADCHSTYPEGFVERAVTSLIQTGAASVVVPLNTKGSGCKQSAIAAAQNSLFGNGGSHHRRGSSSRFVDHGHHAAFVLEDFLRVGGYDESFTHNEDAELDHRLTSSGRRIFLDADLAIDYYPRSTFVALARQYRNYGAGRAGNVFKSRAWPKLRQLIPVAALLAIIGCIALAPIYPALLLVPAFYLACSVVWSLVAAVSDRSICYLLCGPAAIVMQMSWAAGFLSATLQHCLGPKRKELLIEGS